MLQNFDLELSRGAISQRHPAKLYGTNAAIGTSEGVLNLLGTHTYVSDPAGVPLFISSASADDDQRIEVKGLDQNLNPITVIVTLDGQTPVAVGDAQLWLRVFSLKNLDATGTAGIVYVYEATTTTAGDPPVTTVEGVTAGVPDSSTAIRSQLALGKPQTVDGVYTVPAGMTGYLRSIYFSSGGAILTGCDVYVRYLGSSDFISLFHADITSFFTKKKNSVMDQLPAGTDIELRAKGASSTHAVFGSCEIFLVDGAN